MTKTKADGKSLAGKKPAAKSPAKPAKPKAAAKVASKPARKADSAPAAHKKPAAAKSSKTKAAVKAAPKPASTPNKTPVKKKLTQKTAVRKPALKKIAAKNPAAPKSSNVRGKTEQPKSLRSATKATATRVVEPAASAPKRAATAAKAAPAKKATSTKPAAAEPAALKTAPAPQPAAKHAEAPIAEGAAFAEKPAAPAKSKSKSKSAAKSGAKPGEAKIASDGPPVVRPKLNVGQKPRVERSEFEIAQLVVPAATVARTEELAANAVKASPAAKEAKLAFKVNDHIVYPAHGVGRITGIEKQHIAGITNELFVIDFEQEKMKLRVPTSKAAAVGMRGLSDEAQVTKAVDLLKGRARVKRTMWSRRAQEYEAKINSGDIISVAEVVRDLYRATDQPEQSYSERQLFEAALDRLAREVAAVRRKDLAATLADLEASLQQKRAAA